ncbi:MAG: thiamine-phosphate kinase [Steroidobacteraceae bacterium]
MALGEFELIDRFFRAAGVSRADVVLGIGDDGALLRPPTGHDLVAVSDTLVESVHFPAGASPESIGHRALAVNLSDIAAMGATPAWALLSLTLPAAEESWLAAFARGFGELARRHSVALVGGDTTRGPLTLGVQVLGWVPTNRGLRRSGAQPGDLLCVSGTPGDAAAGLALCQAGPPAGANARLQEADAALRARFEFPTPRLALGQRLLERASACIDVSDGLVGDVAKLVTSSGCSARIDEARIPRSPALAALVAAGRFTEDEAVRFALQGGDDYELVFALPPAQLAALGGVADDCSFTMIGELTACSAASASSVSVQRADGTIRTPPSGFEHFQRT